MNPSTTPNPLLPHGPREFKTRNAKWFPYIFGGCFGVFGLIALCAGLLGLIMGGGSGLTLLILIGLVFTAVGVGIPFGLYFFQTLYSITCREDGFSVRTENKRKGTEQHDYNWADVTETAYEEFHYRQQQRSETTVSFRVETTKGRAFKIGRQIGDFAGLINLFNVMTPQLPYTWQPQTGFSIGVGVLQASRSAYHKVERPAAAAAPVPPST